MGIQNTHCSGGWIAICFICQFFKSRRLKGYHCSLLLELLNIGRLPRTPCILMALWVVLSLMALWHPDFPLSPCVYFTHASPSRMVASTAEHCSTEEVNNNNNNTSFNRVREVWLFYCAFQMERAPSVRNSRKLSHIVWATGEKPLTVSKMVWIADSLPIHRQDSRLEC